MTFNDERTMAVFHLRYEHGLDCDQETVLGLFVAHALGHADIEGAEQVIRFAETVALLERNRTSDWLLPSMRVNHQ